MFKNITAFQITEDWVLSRESLEDMLSRQKFHECGAIEPVSRGFFPVHKDGPLVLKVNGQYLLNIREEMKILPSAAINKEVERRIPELEQTQGFAVGRKQKKELKERVRDEMLPKAITRDRFTKVWIDPNGRRLVVDSASSSVVETAIQILGKTLDRLPIARLNTCISPVAAMADWLSNGDCPGRFTIDRECELKSPLEEKATVRYTRHNLDGEEVRMHLAAGKQPTRLAMTWNDRVSLVLTDTFAIKRIAVLDIVKEEAEKDVATAELQYEADFVLITGELQGMLAEIIEALGGIEQQR